MDDQPEYCRYHCSLFDEKLARMTDSICKIEERLNERFEEWAKAIARVEAGLLVDLQRDREVLNDLKKTIFGNGITGLKSQVRLTEQLVNQNAAAIEKLEKTIEKTQGEIRTYIRMAVGALVGAGLSFVGVFGKLLLQMILNGGIPHP